MPRIARVVAVDVPHHVTQRGNNRQPVFLNDSDRRSYCKLLAEWSRRCGLRVLGYCLMTNHVHLVVVPERADALARGLGRAHFLYTREFHLHHGTSGHLWQNRFFSTALDEQRVSNVTRALENTASVNAPDISAGPNGAQNESVFIHRTDPPRIPRDALGTDLSIIGQNFSQGCWVDLLDSQRRPRRIFPSGVTVASSSELRIHVVAYSFNVDSIIVVCPDERHPSRLRQSNTFKLSGGTGSVDQGK